MPLVVSDVITSYLLLARVAKIVPAILVKVDSVYSLHTMKINTASCCSSTISSGCLLSNIVVAHTSNYYLIAISSKDYHRTAAWFHRTNITIKDMI